MAEPDQGGSRRAHVAGEPQKIDASTVVLVRDASDGIETLMLRRNSKLDFVGGMWVFPGGRIDPEDRLGLPDDALGAARRAAVREAREESGLEVAEAQMLPFAHWTPPAIIPRRFLTWFFIAPAPPGQVSIDHGEIHDHAWMRPGEALHRRDAGEIEMAPPTWVSLHWMDRFDRVAPLLDDARAREPEFFATKMARGPDGRIALWHGDAGYASGDAEAAGPRHRLSMLASGWRYERTPG